MPFGMKIFKMKPNYNIATTKAYEILIYNNLVLPIDPYKIKIENVKLKIISMQEYSKLYNFSLDELTQEGILQDGYNATEKRNGVTAALILYNEDIESNERKSFTIAHEIGHVVLGHTEHCEKNEHEADTFAAQLLLPHCILEELVRCGKKVNEFYLKQKFGLSNEAAHISLKQVGNKILKNAKNEYEDIILNLYKNFIDIETQNCKYRYIEEDELQELERNNWW